ncbi:MAG: hypothetical protein KAH30_02385 [Caldisericia bacterium]|nr:hypothetical protein [Caldisericia bacterium]
MMKNADEFYKPTIKEVEGNFGITATGASGELILKMFVTSLHPNFPIISKNILSYFNLSFFINSINTALIIIKNNTAKIYKIFPLSMQMMPKRDIKYGTIVMKEDIFDIAKLEFKDSIYEVNIEDGDRIIYLFRENWKFGLYFDFTKKLKLEKLKEELGYYYKRLFYYDTYLFVENESYFDKMITDGWFPFIRLFGKYFDTIMQYYKDGGKHDFLITGLLSIFTKEKIESFTKYWWDKELFNNKRELIKAGINAFLQNNKDGFITCIHTLYPQIEGIMGTDYKNAKGKKPSFKELMRYIKQKAETKFDTASSVGFPTEFYDYLKKTVFENFNLETGEIDLSRHTALHGYAKADGFTKAKALQAILILDQIYFYL